MNNTILESNSKIAEGYLTNVVDALINQLLPELNGAMIDRINECMTIIARVIHQLQFEMATVQECADRIEPNEWKKIANNDGKTIDKIEETFEVLINSLKNQAPKTDSRKFSREKLALYLQKHKMGQKDLTITNAKILAGGRSKQTILIELKNAMNLPNELVIRQDWSSAVTGTSVITEFELLKKVAEAGLKVPKPFILESNAEVLGSPFLVMQRMPGRPHGDIFHPLESEALALDLADQLARLHQLPVRDFENLGVSTRDFTQEQLFSGLVGFREIYNTVGGKSPTISIVLDWLENSMPKIDGNRCLVHNDLGCHNFLIEGEALTAMLDWELASIGNPAADLGYIRNFIKKMTSWDRFMAAYTAAGGPKISAHTLDFYTLWCNVRLHCLLLRARAGVALGMVHDTEVTYACAQFIPQQHHLISKELRNILCSA